jgi:hypothetical protein
VRGVFRAPARLAVRVRVESATIGDDAAMRVRVRMPAARPRYTRTPARSPSRLAATQARTRERGRRAVSRALRALVRAVLATGTARNRRGPPCNVYSTMAIDYSTCATIMTGYMKCVQHHQVVLHSTS